MKTEIKKASLGTKAENGRVDQLINFEAMSFSSMDDSFSSTIPNNPEKNIPTKPDKNPDPTIPRPGGNEPQKNDPTRIEENNPSVPPAPKPGVNNPQKNDPTRIEEPTPTNPPSPKPGVDDPQKKDNGESQGMKNF